MSWPELVNPVLLLRQREISGGRPPRQCSPSASPGAELKDWAESDLLRHCSSMYCNAQPPPRSTIATAFSPDGTILASTHGDHTVKITCCRTGRCLKVLDGHSRTPWVVRFHPHNSRLLASGSLDNYVRVWDLDCGKCLYSHSFGKPIASLAFHAEGNELAVAAGHRMYIWKYNQEGLTKPVPVVVLKTRRSLRAVHFHPQGAPLLLSAEEVHFPIGLSKQECNQELNAVYISCSPKVNAGHSSRKTPLPVESTGLESRRERRARAERHAATNETIAALEVRIRQRWLEQHRDPPQLQPGASPMLVDDEQEGASGSGRVRLPADRARESREQSSASRTQQVSVELDSSARPGISLSVSGPPGGGPSPAQMDTPFQSMANRREPASTSRPPPPKLDVPSRPYLSLSMPGPEIDSLYPLARHRSAARSAARPVNIGGGRRGLLGMAEGEKWTEGGLLRSADDSQQQEMCRFHAMLRVGGINPAALRSPFPSSIPGQFYTEADNTPPLPPNLRPRSTEVSIPESSRGPSRSTSRSTPISRCCSMDSPSAATATPRSSTCASAPGALPAMPQWESWNAERNSNRRGQLPRESGASSRHCRSEDGSNGSEEMTSIAEEPQRARPPLLNFLSLRRMSVPGLFRSLDVAPATREPPPERDPPRTVLERISNPGGGSGEVKQLGGARLPDLAQVIDGHWSGSSGRARSAAQQRQQAPEQPAAQPHQSSALPPSLVNMGWEFPATNIIPDRRPSHRPGRSQAGAQSSEQEAAGPEALALAVQESQARHATTAEVRSAAANVIGTEQPCHVLVRIWRYDHRRPAELGPLQLAIHNTVLCSEMGVHFSPCGRMVAACAAVEGTAAIGKAKEVDEGEGVPPYELRIYSLESGSFGRVLQFRPIRAAHCLTSIQFSPCSQHIMLAYGRRHISLLRSLIADNRSSIIPVHTVLEVYRVADMSVMRVLPSADDEVNAAAFHPFEGGGIAYGTKEGRLRILTHSSYPLTAVAGSNVNSWTRLEDELLAAAAEQAESSEEE